MDAEPQIEVNALGTNVGSTLAEHAEIRSPILNPTNLGDYFFQFYETIKPFFGNVKLSNPSKKVFESIISLRDGVESAGLMAPHFNTLCDVETLKVEKELHIFDEGQVGSDVNIHKKIPKKGKLLLKSIQIQESMTRLLKQPQHLEKIWKPATKRSQKQDLKVLKEMVITVRIYQPFALSTSTNPKLCCKPRLQQDVKMLGRHYLTDLRKFITCPNDWVRMGDCSKRPRRTGIPCARDLYRSGFFFIENTFYNDTSDPRNVDYSETIREWAASNPDYQNVSLGSAPMEESQLLDVPLCVGKPYLFQHQGGCQHVFFVTDARLIYVQDSLKSSEYPLCRMPMRQNVRLCIMCNYFTAKWVTYDNERVPHDPAIFCDNCFTSFNYKDGVKLCDFTAYPFEQECPLRRRGVYYSHRAFDGLDPPESKAVRRTKEEIAKIKAPPALFAPSNSTSVLPAAPFQMDDSDDSDEG